MILVNKVSYCVVLNNQHKDRLDEIINIHRNDSSRVVLFQPYTKRHMRQLYKLTEKHGSVPIFLIVGNFGDVINAVGLLHKVKYKEDISPEREQNFKQWMSKYDDNIYAHNILFVTNTLLLRNPIPVNKFIKATNNDNLKPGQWPASICYAPPLNQLLAAI